jgi:hypothetical protein
MNGQSGKEERQRSNLDGRKRRGLKGVMPQYARMSTVDYFLPYPATAKRARVVVPDRCTHTHSRTWTEPDHV